MTQIDDGSTSGGTPFDRSATNLAEDRASLRRVVVGAALGFVGVYALIVLMCELVGISFGAALGVGVFVALFGGAGFGAMMGGAMKTDHDA